MSENSVAFMKLPSKDNTEIFLKGNEQDYFENTSKKDADLPGDKYSLAKTPKKKMLTKQVTPKRVLTFEDISDSEAVEQTNKQIQNVTNQVRGKQLLSLNEWCEKRDISLTPMIRLFYKLDLPVIRFGSFVGVYKVHLTKVIDDEMERQVAQQLQNRLCARIITLRQNQEKKARTKKKNDES